MDDNDDFSASNYLKSQREAQERLKEEREEKEGDLNKVKKEYNELKDTALDSTRNAVRVVKETEQTGIRTLKQLDSQGRDLERIQTRMEQVDDNAQKNYVEAKEVKRLGRIFGAGLGWFFHRNKDGVDQTYQDNRQKLKSERDALKETVQKRDEELKQRDEKNISGIQEQGGEQMNNEIPNNNDVDEKEREIDENLDVIAEAVDSLKDIGLQISDEMDSQTITMKGIDETRKHAEMTLERADSKIRDLAAG
jgi:protein transport protein SEC9